MKRIQLLLVALVVGAMLALTAPIVSANGDGGLDKIVVVDRSVATGDQEVPAVDTDMTGVVRTRIRDDSVDIRLRVARNTSEVTAAHLHCAAPGANGGVGLVVFSGTFSDTSGVVVEATFTSDDVVGCEWDDLDDMIASIVAGEVYLNVHTTANPGGEIRADLAPERVRVVDRAIASGMYEVPPAETEMVGMLRTRIDNDSIDLRLRVSGNMSDITAAHLHCAPPGSNGGVGLVVFSGMFSDARGVVFDASFTEADLSGGCGWDDIADMTADIIAGTVYLNVHTVANPAGAIRADLARTFDTVPPTLPEGGITTPASPTNMSPVEVTIAFSEPVEGFGPSDMDVSGGTVTDIVDNQDGTFTVQITPDSNQETISVNVIDGSVSDPAGNILAGVPAMPLVIEFEAVPPRPF